MNCSVIKFIHYFPRVGYHGGRKVRKAKTKLIGKYPCIPKYMTDKEKDPFEYPLRSKEEIAEEQKYLPPYVPGYIIYKYYPNYEPKPYEGDDTKLANTTIRLQVENDKLALASLQRKRFEYLVGPRSKNGRTTITCKQYPTLEENVEKAFEQLKEVYWEAKRAPVIDDSLIKNPYLREKKIKKILGKTKEEREAKLKEMEDLIQKTNKEFEEKVIDPKIQFFQKDLEDPEVRKELERQKAQVIKEIRNLRTKRKIY